MVYEKNETKFTIKAAEAIINSAKNQAHVNQSLIILEQCLNTYNPDEIFLSFNGGKDCTVILHLTAAVFKVRNISPLVCLNVIGDSFRELDDFIDQATNFYEIQLVKKRRPIKSAVAALLEENPRFKASLMGIRRDDPGSEKLEAFKYTDPGWPRVMRVCPILDWSYSQIWQFLLEHKVPYCSLYDQGYTSIGDRTTTVPNPLLRDPLDSSRYLPAHTLVDSSAERNGRV